MAVTAETTPTKRTRLEAMTAAAERIGVPYRSLYDVAMRGHLPFVRLPGNRRLWVRPEDVDRLIEASVERVPA